MFNGPDGGLEPPHLAASDPKSDVSTRHHIRFILPKLAKTDQKLTK